MRRWIRRSCRRPADIARSRGDAGSDCLSGTWFDGVFWGHHAGARQDDGVPVDRRKIAVVLGASTRRAARRCWRRWLLVCWNSRRASSPGLQTGDIRDPGQIKHGAGSDGSDSVFATRHCRRLLRPQAGGRRQRVCGVGCRGSVGVVIPDWSLNHWPELGRQKG